MLLALGYLFYFSRGEVILRSNLITGSMADVYTSEQVWHAAAGSWRAPASSSEQKVPLSNHLPQKRGAGDVEATESAGQL